MIREWNKFKGWVVLEYFLIHPNTKIHINELTRRLKVSLFTTQKFCSAYHEEGLLNKSKIANIHQYSLNEEDARIRTLKSFLGPYLVSDKKYLGPFLKKNKNVLSISIYGSFASGDYGDKSDLDILILKSDERKIISDDLNAIELKLGREVTIISLNFAQWRQMERKKDKLFLSIKKNNINIWGNPI